METKQLLELGFIDTSFYDDEILYTEFKLKKDSFEIVISGIDLIEINFGSTEWFIVPNCKNISDLKFLIKLFSQL